MSVIVPVYNVEEWLSRCLSSIADQDFQSWECIVVIDGSPDSSEDIARRFAARDDRFTVVVVPNGGLGSARNVGLSHASAPWVTFVDSDDEVPPFAFARLMEPTIVRDVDIVVGRAVDLELDGRQRPYWTQDRGVHDDARRIHHWTYAPQLFDDHVAWARVIRRALIDEHHLSFPQQTLCEDMAFSVRAIASARAIAAIPEVVYEHRRHDNAISANYLAERPMRDWMTQADAAIALVASLAPSASESYVRRFFETQWLSRAAKFDAFPNDDIVAMFEDFTARHSGALVAQGPRSNWAAMFAKLVTTGALTGVWARHSRVRSPYSIPPSVTAREALESQLRAVEALDHTTREHCDIALDILLNAVIASLASSPFPSGAEEFDALLERVVSLVALYGQHPYTKATELTTNALVLRERKSGHIDSVRQDGNRVLSFTGTLSLQRPTPHVTSAELVLRSQSSSKVRVRPLWVGEDVGASRRQWWTTIPLAPEFIGEDWKCWIRVHRHGEESVDILLDRDSHASLEVRHESVQPAHLHVQLLEGAGAPWRVVSRPEAATGQEPTPPSPVVSVPRPTLLTFPEWRGNPYLTMLRSEIVAQGWTMRGCTDFDELLRQLDLLGRDDVVHLHWFSPITEDAANDSEARSRATTLLARLTQAKVRGVHVVSSLHNDAPHDARHPAAGEYLQRGMIDLATRLITLTEAPSALSSLGVSAGAAVHIPHASYVGVYGARLSREVALAELKADPTLDSVLFFGQIRPYKGLDLLIDALALLPHSPPSAQLLVAGKPSPSMTEWGRRLDEMELPTTSSLQFIRDNDVSVWFSAASVMVLPYSRILNSGSVELAATYGVPTILPSFPHLVEAFAGEDWVAFFDLESPAASIASLVQSRFYAEERVRVSALEHARRYTPHAMACDYADLLESLITPR